MDTAILANLYGAGQDPGRLEKALDGIGRMTNATCITLHWFDRKADRLHTRRMDTISTAPRELLELAKLDALNPRTLAAVNPFNENVSYLVDSTIPAGLQSELSSWQDRLTAFGMGYFLGARIPMSANKELGLALFGGLKNSFLSDSSKDILREFMPHLREAAINFEAAMAEKRQVQNMSCALDQFQQPMVIGNTKGMITLINDSAAESLRKLGISSQEVEDLRQGKCKATGTLGKLLSSCNGLEGAHRIRTGGTSMSVRYKMMRDESARAQIESDLPSYLLLFPGQDTTMEIKAEALRAYFPITPRESELLACLCQGEELAQYAAERQLSIHTARSQLKQLMMKTGARRQADLVRIALASPPAFIRN